MGATERRREGVVARVALAPSEGGHVTPATPVAGLPLLVRLARQLQGLGATRLLLLGVEELKTWRDLLASHGVDLELEGASEGAPGAKAAALEATAVYDSADLERFLSGTCAAITPRVRVSDPQGVAEAEAWLWASIRKSMSHDGPVAYYLARPVSGRLSRLLLPTGISPNAVTLMGLAVGLASGAVAAVGGYGPVLCATGLFYLGMVLDCVDGDLARIKLATSRVGQWLDTVTDDLSVVALTVGRGVGLWRQWGESLYLAAGLGGAALVVLGQAMIYLVLVRSGGPMDTARYPWFFSSGAGLAQEGERSVLGYLSFLFRRDCLTLVFVLLALAGQGRVILSLLVGGGAVYFVLLLVDRTTKALGLFGGDP